MVQILIKLTHGISVTGKLTSDSNCSTHSPQSKSSLSFKSFDSDKRLDISQFWEVLSDLVLQYGHLVKPVEHLEQSECP